jgi:PEP-CTERM motif
MGKASFVVTSSFACFGLFLSVAATGEAAAAISTTTYEFTANCTDCAAAAGSATYIVHGDLVLTDSYVLGMDFTPDFVSFTYDGSNLFPKFTIDTSDILFMSGALPTALPGPPSEFIQMYTKTPFGPGPANGVQIHTDGSWFIGPVMDTGTGATFALPPIPEPSTWAMMALGFAGLGIAGHRAARRAAAAA